jgi:cyclase
MSLAKRIIPCLDVDKGRVVKGKRFGDLRDIGDPVEMAIKYRDDGADEIIFLDITATIERRKTLAEIVERVASKIDIPFTVGGGIRSVDDVFELLRRGADKISINTAAFENPEIISTLADKFGSQCVVVAIDAKKTFKTKSGYEVFTHSGKVATGTDVIEWAKKVESLGAGELLLTSIDRDGTKMGYDLDLIKLVVSNVKIPVIASGGVGSLNHFYQAFKIGNADAALAASVFHYGDFTIKQVKEFLYSKGINVRLV